MCRLRECAPADAAMSPTLCLLALSAYTVSAAVLNSGVVIPTYARICYRNDPNNEINDCLREAIQTLIKRISGEGIRQLGLPPLDPWHVPEMSITIGNGEPFKVSFTSRDTNTYGFSRLKIHGVRAELDDPKRISIEADFTNDKIYIEGDYEAEGTISDYPILGKGTFNVSMTDVSGIFKLRGHLIQRDGDEFLLIDRATMRPDVGNLTMGMTNENNKYPELTNLFIGLVNQFWKSIYQETLPYAEESFDRIMRPTFNLATLKIPFNQLIPLYEE